MAWSPSMRFLFSNTEDEADTFRQLLYSEESGITQRTTLGSTLLHLSVLANRPITTATIIALGNDVNALNDFEETPLHWAVRVGNSHMCGLLIAHKAAINVEDSDGNTPLHWASEYNHGDVIQLLLDHNANPNYSNLDDETPLETATRFGNVEAVKILLEAPNVKIHRRSKITGATLLDHALFSEDNQLIQLVSPLFSSEK